MSSSYTPTGGRTPSPAATGCRALELLLRLRPREWVILGGIVATTRTARPSTTVLPAATRPTTTIDDVWRVGRTTRTGSNDIVVEEAFVPEYRSLSFTDVTRCAGPGQERNAAPLYRIPYGSVFSYAITTPVIGMAAGAYDAHVAYQRERVRASYVGQRAFLRSYYLDSETLLAQIITEGQQTGVFRRNLDPHQALGIDPHRASLHADATAGYSVVPGAGLSAASHRVSVALFAKDRHLKKG